MTLSEILSRLRTDILDDNATPYNWSDATLLNHLNDAIDEMCEECNLIVDTQVEDVCQFVIGVDAANISEGTNTATLKIVSDIEYEILGSEYTKAAVDNVAMTACTQQAISKYCRYLISADEDGNVTVTKGADATTSALAELPELPSGEVPIGMLLIKTDASHTFTSGTTDLSATGITATFESSPTQFQLDDRIITVDRAKLVNGNTSPMSIKHYSYMDSNYSDWENQDAGDPYILIEGKNRDYVQPWPPAENPDVILMTVTRKPITDMAAASTSASPEIPKMYHKYLLHGVAYRCYLQGDEETLDDGLEEKHLALWAADKEKVKRLELKRGYHKAETVQVPYGVI